METTKKRPVPIENRITVNVETLAAMLDCGRGTAMKIGERAGARVNIGGSRVLFSVSKVRRYIDEHTGQEGEETCE